MLLSENDGKSNWGQVHFGMLPNYGQFWFASFPYFLHLLSTKMDAINVLPLSGHNAAVLWDTKLVGKDVGHGKSASFSYNAVLEHIWWVGIQAIQVCGMHGFSRVIACLFGTMYGAMNELFGQLINH